MNEEVFCETMAISIHALRRCAYTYGTCVFISSANASGIATAVAVKRYGARSVAVCCANENEAKLVREMGLYAYQPEKESIAQLKENATENRGFDYAFETGASEQGYAMILDAVKRGAAVGVLAKLEKPYKFFVKTAIRSQIRFVGVHSAEERDRIEAKKIMENGEVRNLLAKI